MKINLTDVQIEQMASIFRNMNALAKDKEFMKMLKYAEQHMDSNDFRSIELANFTENIIDTAKNNSNIGADKACVLPPKYPFYSYNEDRT